MQAAPLVGEFEVTLDAKNRVALPARLRDPFTQGFYVVQERERCLGGYSPAEFQARLSEDVGVTRAGSAQRRDAKRRLTPTAAYFPHLDAQGRVTLPAKHLAYAGISRDVTIIGAVDHMEIWDRAAWTEYQAHLEEEADAPADVHPAS